MMVQFLFHGIWITRGHNEKKVCLMVVMVLATILLFPSLAAAFGNITISSVPYGATVLVDSVSTGATTPTTIEGVSSGTHNIVLRLTGYQDYTQIVTVSNNATSTVSGTLIALTTTTQQVTNGSIKVELNPSNAAVFLNMEYQGKTPLTLSISLMERTGFSSRRLVIRTGQNIFP